ncbi:MAG TPA: hypothetical protein VK832_04575 [Burkholderiaceae bacterium]|nr:hypothetical protein [Burkholderiaceae bacterium]
MGLSGPFGGQFLTVETIGLLLSLATKGIIEFVLLLLIGAFVICVSSKWVSIPAPSYRHAIVVSLKVSAVQSIAFLLFWIVFLRRFLYEIQIYPTLSLVLVYAGMIATILGTYAWVFGYTLRDARGRFVHMKTGAKLAAIVVPANWILSWVISKTL